MNPKNTWMLVLLAGGLFAFIFFYERRIQPPAPAALRVFPGLKTEEITSIAVHPRDEFEVRADRTNGGWQLVKKNAAYPVQLPRLENFLKALGELTAQSRLSDEELKGRRNVNAEFGLDNPLFTILIQIGDDQRVLKLGNPTPPGNEIYAQVVGGAEGIEIISADFLKTLPSRPDDWRSTVFMSLDGLVFDHLRVANGDKKLELLRESTNGFWRLDKPTPAHANNPGLILMLEQLGNLRRNQFVTDDPGADLDAYGLQPPRLELTMAQGTNPVLTLQFGKSPSNDESQVYARIGGDNSIALVSADPLAPWRAGPDTFRDPRLITQGSDWPDNIEVTNLNETQNFTVQTGPDGWILTDWQKTNLPVDLGSLGLFVTNLYKLTNARPDGRFALDAVTEQDLQSHGLVNPLRSYLLTRMLTNSAGTNREVIAKLDFGTNSEGALFARRRDLAYENSIYAVSSNEFNRLPPTALQLRERQIWKFDPADVVRFTIETNGVIRHFNHERTNVWTEDAANYIQDLNSVQYRGIVLEQLVEQLGTLKADYWIQRGEQGATNYGIVTNSPRFTVEFKNHDKSTLVFGALFQGHVFASARPYDDTQNWIFFYSPSDAESFFSYLKQMLAL